MTAPGSLPSLISPLSGVRSPFLLDWRATDLTVAPRTGQAPTFTRAGAGTYLDSNGYIRTAPYGMPRLSMSGAGGRIGLLVERATTNLLFGSEDLGNSSYWTRTTVTSSNVAGPGFVAQRLSDASAVGTGAVTRAVTMAAGWHALSLFWRAGATPGSVVQCGSIKALIVQDGAGAPIVTASVGRFLGSQKVADGWYRLLFGSTSSQSGASYTVSFAPADTLGGDPARIGYADFGGVMMELAPEPSGYVKSVGSAGTRVAESFNVPLGWAPRELTIYAEWARPAWAGVMRPANYRTIVSVGNEGVMLYDAAAGDVRAYAIGSGSASVAIGSYPEGALGDTVRAAVVARNATTAVTSAVETEAGPAVVGTIGGAQLSYPLDKVGIGSHATTPGYELDGLLYAVRIAAGARSLASMVR